MSTVCYTEAQKQRLTELSAPKEACELTFEDAATRDEYFKREESSYAKQNRERILDLVNRKHKPILMEVEEALSSWLTGQENFTRVMTPAFITKEMLARMTISGEHPLTNQVFWLDSKRCLRPMLAPNLYVMMRDIYKISRAPVKIFEAGSCFRKESQGAQHLNEFTMLNLVELASVEEGEQMDRLIQLAKGAMKTLQIDDYQLVTEKSEVYGETLDVVVGELELASGAFGPHFLDDQWGVFETWVGIGFGLERIAMLKGGYQNIKRVGRGLAYLDGARLNV